MTGVGTSDVYVADDISGNHFTIGGKSDTKVYWTVTGERKDQTVEIGKILTPVEMPKTGDLAGRSLDDEGLVGTLDQLKRMGYAGKFTFKTARGRQKYEDMHRPMPEVELNEKTRLRKQK